MSWNEPRRNSAAATECTSLPNSDLAHLVEHEDQPVGEQYLRQVIAAVEPLDEHALQQEARDECDRDAADDRDAKKLPVLSVIQYANRRRACRRRRARD